MMAYLNAIVTAFLTFISPCVLPLLPVYVTYFAAGKQSKWTTFFNALGFCTALSIFFMTIFVSTALASVKFQNFIMIHKFKFLVVGGIILILLGLKFMGYLNLPFLDISVNVSTKAKNVNFLSAFLLGLIISVSIVGCGLGFLMKNLSKVLTEANLVKGIMIGAVFTLTLDILFIICAMLLDQLKSLFGFIKKHYRVINLIAGTLLVIYGFLMALGFTQSMF